MLVLAKADPDADTSELFFDDVRIPADNLLGEPGQGFIQAITAQAAAFTIEHPGASERADLPNGGYAATGRNAYMNWPATDGPLNDMLIEGIKRHDPLHHAVEQGPGYTTGRVFHNGGIPHIACISGPNYLPGIAANGHMDKLDADLAARQTAMIADMIRQADALPIATLRGSDKSLGADPVTGPDTANRATCPVWSMAPDQRPRAISFSYPLEAIR